MLALQHAVTGHDPRDHAADDDARPHLEVVPFQPWHLEWLRVQSSQVALSPTLTVRHGMGLQAAGPCYTAFAGGTVIACAGIVEFWSGRSQVWSLLSDNLFPYRLSIHRAVSKFLIGYRVRRLECVIDPRSEAARRWADHLGFEYESHLYGYTPQGETQMMLVRFE